MNASFLRPIVLCSAMAALLSGCGSSDHSDLDRFMSEVKAKPAGHIKPIPPFKTYEAFAYSSTALRSPFERPVEIREITRLQMSSSVAPDKNRTKEFLEQYSIDSLKMVGTLEQNKTLWALMKDKKGGVHRVAVGNYLGRNHGRVVSATESYLSVVEIVSNGLDGWVERPRTIKLKISE